MASRPPPTGTDVALVGADLGADAGERVRGRARLGSRDAGQRRDHDRAGLGLPPRVDDRTSAAADVQVIPDPGFGVDRLADRSHQANARQVMLCRPLGAPLHEGADRGRRRVEHGDAVSLDDFPQPIFARPIRRALVHDHRRAIGERAVDDVTVPGDPADIGGAPIHVFFLQIEHPLRGGVTADEVAARGVDDALRLSGGAGRVEDVEHVLGVQGFGRTVVRGILHQAVIPVVAALLDVHRDVGEAALHDDDVFDARCLLERFVGDLLERDDRAAPIAAVGGDEHRCGRVVDAIAQRLGAESAEHHGMDGADARARQHRDRQLGNERHVERDAIALLDAERLQDVGELAHLPEEIEVRQRAPIARLALPDKRRLVAAPGAHVAIETIGADVELAADKPLGVRRVPLEHFRPRLNPLELLRKVFPEAFRILPRPWRRSPGR